MPHWLRNIPLSRRIVVHSAVCAIFVVSSATVAMAGGLYLNEFGTSAMGTAGAGAQAYANDASTAFHNPAGMTRIDGRQLSAGAGLIFGEVQFDPDADTPEDGGDGGDAVGLAPIVGSHYVHSVSDKLKLGMNVGAITGAALDYNNSWTGRYQNQKISLLSVSFLPAVAFRINDRLSIGGGVNITYGRLDMDVAIPNPEPGQSDGKVKVEDADDWDVGFDLGVLFELSEDTRFGVTYFSGIEPRFSGDAKIIPVDLEAGIDIDLTFPEMVRGSIYHKLNQKFALLSTVGWENWSDFDRVPISVGQGSTVARSHFDDTWHFSGGLHYIPNEKWMFMTGVAYDTSPVGKKHRNAALPSDRQVRLALGTQYHWQENIAIGAAIVYADLGDAAIQRDNLIGDYSNNDLLMIAFNFSWKL